MINRLAVIFGLVFGVSCIATSATYAQPAPTLTTINPRTVVRGQGVDLSLAGDQLAGAVRVLVLDTAGLATEFAPGAANGSPVRLNVNNDDKRFTVALAKAEPKVIAAKLTIAADAAIGARQVVVVTPAGVSNPIDLFVVEAPDIDEVEPNNTIATAQAVDRAGVIAGVIHTGGEVDCYRFTAKRGERLVFDALAQRIGSSMDTSMDLIDAATGRVVAGSEDRFGTDSFIDYAVPADGAYVLRLRDLRYGGGGGYFYRLRAGVTPHLAGVFPLGAQRGKPAAFQLLGANLPSKPLEFAIDANTPTGDAPVRVRTPGASGVDGVSNALAIEVSDDPQFVETEPNNTAAEANVVATPIVISGRLDKPGDVDVYRFKPGVGRLIFEVSARRIGSPLDPVLTLGNAQGGAIQRDDDAGAGVDARIDRGDLNTQNEYTITVSDLVGRGGSDYVYRLTIRPAPAPDVAVRFRPDRLRVHRGGHAMVWADVQRRNGFKGDVTLAFESLPRGVTIEPVTFAEGAAAQQVFVINAANDADLASQPITLVAKAKVSEAGLAEVGSTSAEGDKAVTVRHAFLTVLDAAPFTVAAQSPPSPAEQQAIAAEAEALEKTLATQTPALDAEQVKWETESKNIIAGAIRIGEWHEIGPFSGGDAFETAYEPEKTVDLAKTYAGNLTWKKHPEWTDGAVYNPWTDDNAAHYLYREISVDAPRELPLSLGSDDGIKVFHNGTAVLSNNTGRGAAADQEKVTLKLTAGVNRVLIKIVNGSGPSGFYFKADAKSHGLPDDIVAILTTDAAKRSDAQRAAIAAYHRTVAASLEQQRLRLAELRKQIDPKVLIAQLQKQLDVQTPALDEGLAKWEASGPGNQTWSVLDYSETKATSGARFTKGDDGAVLLEGERPAKDTYTLVAPVSGLTIRAVRLEALPDAKLPAGGPGRADNGNFVLTQFNIEAAPGGDATAFAKVTLQNAKQTFAQSGFAAASVLDGNDGTGWAVSPQFNQKSEAIFDLAQPLDASKGVVLRITMRNESQYAQHNLGKFRISVIGSDKPDFAQPLLPADVVAILRTPRDQRNDAQKQRIAAYYRTLAPELQPIRDRIAQLELQSAPFPPVMERKGVTTLPVRVARAAGFTGDIMLTLEGYSSGRDGNQNPNPITTSIDVKPITLTGAQTAAAFTLTAIDKAEQGTRPVVIKAEANIDGYTVTEYSETIPVTVK